MPNGICLVIRGVDCDVWSHYLVPEPQYVGRTHDCDVILAYQTVSRLHALIEHDSTGFLVRDLGSTNGTFVNDHRVLGDECGRFTRGDRLGFGQVVLDVLWLSAEQRAAVERGAGGKSSTPLCPRGWEELLEIGILTPRQREAVPLLLQGMCEKHVAQAMGVSIATAHTFIHQIFRAFNVHSHSQLMAVIFGTLHRRRGSR